MSAERSREKAVLDYLTDPQEGPGQPDQEADEDQTALEGLEQFARQKLDAMISDAVFVFMYVELGTLARSDVRKVTAWFLTKSEVYVGAICKLIDSDTERERPYIELSGPMEWNERLIGRLIRQWVNLPWAAVGGPFDLGNPESMVRIAIIDKRAEYTWVGEIGFKALSDLLIMYGAMLTQDKPYNDATEVLLQRLEGLRKGLLNRWAHRLAQVHQMRM